MAHPGFGSTAYFGTTSAEVLIPGVISISVNQSARDVLEVTDLSNDYHMVRPGRTQAPTVTVVCHYAAGLPSAAPASIPSWGTQSLKIVKSDATFDTWLAFINGSPGVEIVGEETIQVTYEFQCQDANPTSG